METRRIAVLLLITLLAVSTYTFVGSVNAQESEVTIRFNAAATGHCFVGYGSPGPGYPDPYEWYGLGRGTASISGSADAIPYPGTYLDILGDVYMADFVDAQGVISLDWTEESGDTHSVKARLYSTTSTGFGVFIPEAEVFGVPAAGQAGVPITKLFGLSGIHRSGSSIERISGLAMFMVAPAGFSPYSPPTSLRSVSVYFGSDLSQQMYMAHWLNEQANLPIAGPGSPTILVPEANVFHSNVKIV